MYLSFSIQFTCILPGASMCIWLICWAFISLLKTLWSTYEHVEAALWGKSLVGLWKGTKGHEHCLDLQLCVCHFTSVCINVKSLVMNSLHFTSIPSFSWKYEPASSEGICSACLVHENFFQSCVWYLFWIALFIMWVNLQNAI